MKIFKELKKLGYIHYSATTIEELDDLPLNSARRISEQALVLRWFRKKYELYHQIKMFGDWATPTSISPLAITRPARYEPESRVFLITRNCCPFVLNLSILLKLIFA